MLNVMFLFILYLLMFFFWPANLFELYSFESCLFNYFFYIIRTSTKHIMVRQFSQPAEKILPIFEIVYINSVWFMTYVCINNIQQQSHSVRSAGKYHIWRHENKSKRRVITRSGKGNKPQNIKTDVEQPILKLGSPNFRWSFYFILLLVASLLFRRIFMTSHMPLSSDFSANTKCVFLCLLELFFAGNAFLMLPRI